jgi:tRNA threonylcarbamoyladenosine biosynthesis protein TsaE
MDWEYLQRRRGFGLAESESTGMSQIDALPAGDPPAMQLEDAFATARLGQWLAGLLLEGPWSAPPILLLQGNLGAGKTCLVQGLAAGLGIQEPITSPTFALAQHYRGSQGGRATALVHLDLYRLEEQASAEELFAQEEEEARALQAVLAVEWPERLRFALPEAWRLELGISGERRCARLRGPGGAVVPAPEGLKGIRLNA